MASLLAAALIGVSIGSHGREGNAVGPAGYSTVFVNAEGLDACPFYSAHDWNTEYNYHSNLYGLGFYAGGQMADYLGCFEGTTTWLSNIYSGWKLEPIWDGLQASCSGQPKRMSSNGNTANQQGKSAAVDAVIAWENLGLPATGNNIIYDDMEGYPSSCEPQVKRFLNGWVSVLHDYAFKAGVYPGSTVRP